MVSLTVLARHQTAPFRYVPRMTEDTGPERHTPVWLWVVLGVGIVILGAGSFVARVDHQLIGVPVFAVGLAVVVTFIVLRGRHTGT